MKTICCERPETAYWVFQVDDPFNENFETPDFVAITSATTTYEEAVDEAESIEALHYSHPVSLSFWEDWTEDEYQEYSDMYIIDVIEG